MSEILCDTNVFIKLFNNDPIVIAELSKIGNKRILMPSISAMELYVGMRDKQDLQQMRKRIKLFNCLHLNELASEKGVELIANYRLSHGLMIPDALIAAMAVTYDLELFTYNSKDFKFIPNIRLYPLP
jgi:predicted nucleic acid-binding protein